MSDKQPMQASGQGGEKGSPDGTNQADGVGDGGGGAYPNPHTGKDRQRNAGFMGHGGQSDMNYHGTGQLGDEKVDKEGAPNSATRGE